MLKIAVTGVESTGKSMLSRQLATWYDCGLVPEFARQFLANNGNTYNYRDFIQIAKGQAHSEDLAFQMHKQEQLLILDTDFIVIKVWSEVVYGYIEEWITERIVRSAADHYLLCEPTIPWVQDGMREYPDQQDRDIINKLYIKTLNDFNCKFTLINDTTFAGRFLQAAAAIDQELNLTVQT